MAYATTTWPSRIASGLILLLPVSILMLAAVRYHSGLLLLAAVAQFLGAILFLRHAEVWKPPVSGSIILLYIMALGFLWFVTRENSDSFARLMRGVLIIAAVSLFMGHDITRTGLGPRRRANKLTRQLIERQSWPTTINGFSELAIVHRLQVALRDDPSPIFPLLENPRPEVRIAAFMSLEPRTNWRTEDAEIVLHHLQLATEPMVRIAGIQALANVSSGTILQYLANYLIDPSQDVRQKAAEVLLSRSNNWSLVREGFREALVNPTLFGEGSMPGTGGRLAPMAICDLVTWASEPEPLRTRASRTLVNHYAVLLMSGNYPTLGAELSEQVVDPHTPPVLRLEVANLLRSLGFLTPHILDRMSNADQPGPLRLLAAEVLLSNNPEDADAIDVLRGLGRQPHRETALAIARLVQTYLGYDMGLPEGKVTPNSKVAVEAARRVLQWATGRTLAQPTQQPQRNQGNSLKETAIPSIARPGKPSPWGNS